MLAKKILKMKIANSENLRREMDKINVLSRISLLGKSQSGSDIELVMNLINTIFMIPLISYEIAKKHIK